MVFRNLKALGSRSKYLPAQTYVQTDIIANVHLCDIYNNIIENANGGSSVRLSLFLILASMKREPGDEATQAMAAFWLISKQLVESYRHAHCSMQMGNE